MRLARGAVSIAEDAQIYSLSVVANAGGGSLMLKMLNGRLKSVTGWVIATIFGSFILAGVAQAATIISCASDGKTCDVRLQEGIIKDRVQVLDVNGHVIGEGELKERSENRGVIFLSSTTKVIKRGYPVIIKVGGRNSSLQWTAAFSSKD